jgi:hypothetical protein
MELKLMPEIEIVTIQVLDKSVVFHLESNDPLFLKAVLKFSEKLELDEDELDDDELDDKSAINVFIDMVNKSFITDKTIDTI